MLIKMAGQSLDYPVCLGSLLNVFNPDVFPSDDLAELADQFCIYAGGIVRKVQ